jgi:hypothetical protein
VRQSFRLAKGIPDNSDYEERWHSVQFQGNVPHLSRSDVVSLIASGKPQALGPKERPGEHDACESYERN